MLASNWPVILLKATYVDAWNHLRDLLAARLPAADDQAAVLAGTARRIYRLPTHPAPAPRRSNRKESP